MRAIGIGRRSGLDRLVKRLKKLYKSMRYARSSTTGFFRTLQEIIDDPLQDSLLAQSGLLLNISLNLEDAATRLQQLHETVQKLSVRLDEPYDELLSQGGNKSMRAVREQLKKRVEGSTAAVSLYSKMQCAMLAAKLI